ncbi:hypothetical protein DFR52_101438 [Hoeflea marina]|uniref:Uncharacterized protein n=1 Tax=Hoeflea marina TaxID=274592 RepID=A0A317PQL4_9HYPH|nr:hypothetical protein [Hoeflea marina]PWW03752.1 hypothetical protein DFR52_101438 [Hoeflea marina]
MADDFKTLREVGHGISGIRHVLNLYGAVFATCVAAFLFGGWQMFGKIDRVEDSTARIDERLARIETLLAGISAAPDAGSGKQAGSPADLGIDDTATTSNIDPE